ncbi:Peptide transporter PTR2 [Hordeum vulgare]|nr:Peptide transporter PTR2 [Hordeum vulgare]
MVDITRLNDTLISLIPKVKGTELISRFRLIAFMNNMAKFPAKGFSMRLSPLVHPLSRLKINFLKSEDIITGVHDVEALRVAHLLNCSLGSFPFKYLGLPIAPDKLCAKEFAPIVTKVGHRVLS